VIAKALKEGLSSVASEIDANRRALTNRTTSTRIHDHATTLRLASITEDQYKRQSPYNFRKALQHNVLKLPLFPTTTIGSFPQTAEVRKYRSDFKTKKIGEQEYEDFLKHETIKLVRLQEELSIDVLVHGEFERNDMVEYFGEHLNGLVSFTIYIEVHVSD